MDASDPSDCRRPAKAGDNGVCGFHGRNVAKCATNASTFVAKQETAQFRRARYYEAMLSQWLQNVMDERSLRQAELSRLLSEELGRSIDRAAVNKMLKGSRSISGDELLAIERITGMPAPRSQPVTMLNMRHVDVVGHVQAGYWTEAFQWPDEHDHYTVSVPVDPKYASYSLRGAELRGASMNKWRPEGTVVVFTDQIETAEDLRLGSRYVIERTNAAGEHECTVKTLWQDEQGELWLLPESTDPRFQEPLHVSGADGDTIRIMGRVTYSVAREE